MKKINDPREPANYNKICKYSNETARMCKTRNFNYYITNPESDHIAVTYRMCKQDEFWGLDCGIGEQDIVKWLISDVSPYANRLRLDAKATELIRNRKWRFEVPYQNTEVLKKAMCKRVLLAFAFHFYFSYKCTDEIAALLKDIWKETEITEFDCIDINNGLKCLSEVQDSYLKINGRLSDSIIAKLHSEGIRYSIEFENGNHVIFLHKSDRGGDILHIYKDKDISSAVRCVSPVFYSGAMARVKRIIEQKNYGNDRIYNYLFDLEAVSYGTHLGLKDPRAGYISEYFSDEEKMALREFDENESRLQDILIQALEENIRPIDAINDYLSNSGSTHGMNTSSNIVTSDDLLVFTKRGSKTFDSQTIYCSSNGVCEKFDETVAFYHNTVDCDLPTIAEKHSFGSFGGELTREAYAELGVYIDPTLWRYYGFTVMGYRSDSRHRFPLHFNILAHAHTEKTIKQIRKNSVYAVEKEENENILGIGVELARNPIEAFKIKIKHVLRTVYNHKDLISDSLILFTLAILFDDKFSNGSNFWQSMVLTIRNISFVDWISFFIALLTLSFTVVEVRSIISEAMQKYNQTYFFIRNRQKNNDYQIISKCLKKAMKNAGCNQTNPIFTLMFQLYYYQKTNE